MVPNLSVRHDFHAASPDEVRAALIPEERAEFDRSDDEDLDDWRRIAWLTVSSGHHGYREMWRRAAAAYTGKEVPMDEPFVVTKARLGC